MPKRRQHRRVGPSAARHNWALRFGLTLALCLIVITASAVSPQAMRYFTNQLTAWEVQLEGAEKELQAAQTSTARLEALRAQLKDVEVRAEELLAEAKAGEADVSTLLTALGPEPGEEDAPEEASVATRRADLSDQLAFYEGVGKRGGLLVTRTDLAQQKITQVLVARKTRALWVRGEIPLSPRVLRRVPQDLAASVAPLRTATLEELAPMLAKPKTTTQATAFVAVLLLAIALGWPVRRWLLRRFARDPNESQPSFARRLKAAVAVGIARGFLPSLSALVVLSALGLGADVMGPVAQLAVAAVLSFVFVVMVSALAQAVLAPRESAWRCSSVGDVGARRLYNRLVALASVAAVTLAVEFLAARHLDVSTELAALGAFLADTAIAVLILSLLPARLWQSKDSGTGRGEARARKSTNGYTLLRAGTGLLAVGIPLSGLFGYHHLADYLAIGLLRSAVIVGAFAILHGLVKDAVALALGRDHAATAAADDGQASDQSARMLSFWIVAVVDLILALAAAVALLFAWGLSWADLREWLGEYLSGITIGNITLSLGGILSAALVLIAALAITRWLQRVLERRVLPQTRLDVGARDALKSGLGYVGVVLAVLFAVSALGLDLSNLAIVAGALSVGIGFGLQNIVNNFVSGLILLVERPIKVGDWVVVGGQEGYVKRINVRATEVQTFQRASVIIPNSELISTAVTNWTHKDTFGRVDIPIGVAYGSDTDRVKALLLQCARDYPKVNAWPAPYVLFRDFGASSLDFELRFHVSNVDERLSIGSDVRYAIDRAFREAGIEIPFQQTDIHLRDIDRVERLLGGTASEEKAPERPPATRPAAARKSR